MGLVFLVILAADWGLNIFLFSKVRNYAIPVLSIFFPLVCIAGLAGHGQMQSVYKQNAIAKFSFYVLWFVFAILLELALSSGPYSVPLEDQWRVYWSFGQVIFWAFAGYQFVQRREDAAWLLHRFAVGMACICALSYLLIAAGKSEMAVITQTETGRLADPAAAAPRSAIGLPNWGPQSFLLFGYCWFLTRTLIKRRLFSGSMAGLLACCELPIQMTKSTIFAIVPGTLAILGLLLLRTRQRLRVLVAMAVIVGFAAGGFMIANALSKGELLDRVLSYAAKRYFKVQRLDMLDQPLSDIATTGSSGRMGNIWPEAMRRFETSPVFGCGFNQDLEGLPMHNTYLEVLIGVGLLGALPVLLCFLWWFKTVWKAARLPENMPLLVPCLGYAVCFCALNAGDLIRYFHTPLMFFGLVLGISMKVALLPLEHGGSQLTLGSVDRT